MCLRRLTSACLLLRTLCFFLISGTYFVFHEMTSHISYQENNVGKQEKFKDIKWVIINNKLRIGNTLVKRKNRTQERTIICKN